ncbi:MAG: DUF255 domain-containing protein [Filomicrobium sp.]
MPVSTALPLRRSLFALGLVSLVLPFALTGWSAPVAAENTSTAQAAKPKKQPAAYRLANEASPYLRQHADNPVEWYPWGRDAFDRAKRENKPIFLSVGYSTCYWCHVMKRESFEDEGIAKFLNEHFISVKVDRERRPDVDTTYMLATELISQRGGWPNSVFLTPDLKPFFALTYAPPAEFKSVSEQVASTWKSDEEALRADAERVAEIIARITGRKNEAVELTPSDLRRANLAMLKDFDVFNGGIGTAPKFPRENVLHFLLHRATRDNDELALEALELTLDNIIRGGINDHVAGGFHRYATDNAWAVPHFEKMLYNQALIGNILVKTFELTGRKKYADAARKTFDFVLRDMTTAEGGFASAFDAETDGKEGLFYLWTKADFDKALEGDAEFGAKIFGVTEDGNHEGMNTLRFVSEMPTLAQEAKLSLEDFQAKATNILAKLNEVRQKRPKLKRDDKVIANWNAAMVRTLADASSVLKEPRYLEAAERAMVLQADKLGAGTKDMQRTYFEGKTGLPASQADHALTGLAALALHDAGGSKRWLEVAKNSARILIEDFADPAAGDYFLTKSETGFVRTKQYDDGDLPAGNALALDLFVKLTRRDADPQWAHAAESLSNALSGLAKRTPMAMATTLVALDSKNRGEAAANHVLAKGNVKLAAQRTANGKSARVVISLAPGWHINSNAPAEDFLIPTALKVEGREPNAMNYPEAIERKLGFNAKPLLLYEGEANLEFALPEDANETAQRATLTFQACSDKICLAPETAELLFPPKPAS